MTDIPSLTFVDPAETDDTYRVCLWAAPGQGKSVAAASAPDPILVLSADRPSAYRFARKHHHGKTIHETRYEDPSTLDAVYRFIREGDTPVRTLVIDPIGNIVDDLANRAPLRDGDTDYAWVNKKVLGFVRSLRKFDINVVLIAHEKLNDGKKGDGKLYPAVGGPALINKILAEMDIVAHIERHVSASEEGEETVRWIGQIQPRNNLVCKDSTPGGLGDRRIADLSRWFELASAATQPDEPPVPWEEPAGEAEEPADDGQGTLDEDAA